MLDTLTVSCPIEGVTAEDLEHRGWDLHISRLRRGDDVRELRTATLAAESGVRLAYFEQVGWLRVEASLPRVATGRNDGLLSWPECSDTLSRLTAELAPECVQSRLPPLDRWKLCRLDPVWAWPVDPGPYLAALHLARLRGSQPVSENGSVRWRSVRSGSIWCRLYDKSKEQGRQVDLPTRFERQLRVNKRKVKAAGREVSRNVAELTEDTCLTLLREGVAAVGLDRPVKTVAALRGQLVDALGRRAGRNVYRVLLEVQAEGCWPYDLAPSTRRKYERQLEQAGVGMVSLTGELPGLTV